MPNPISPHKRKKMENISEYKQMVEAMGLVEADTKTKEKTKKGYAFADKLYKDAVKKWKDGSDPWKFVYEYRNKLDEYLSNKLNLYTWTRDPNIAIAYEIEGHLIEKLSKLVGKDPNSLY